MYCRWVVLPRAPIETGFSASPPNGDNSVPSMHSFDGKVQVKGPRSGMIETALPEPGDKLTTSAPGMVPSTEGVDPHLTYAGSASQTRKEKESLGILQTTEQKLARSCSIQKRGCKRKLESLVSLSKICMVSTMPFHTGI